MYEERQPPFLNAVCVCASPPAPHDLLRFIQEIEASMGRVPGPKNSPRPLDIDILLYGALALDEPDLVIPHPAIAERPFVLVPLAEIDPNAVHPVNGKTAAEMLAALSPPPATPSPTTPRLPAGPQRPGGGVPSRFPPRGDLCTRRAARCA